MSRQCVHTRHASLCAVFIMFSRLKQHERLCRRFTLRCACQESSHIHAHIHTRFYVHAHSRFNFQARLSQPRCAQLLGGCSAFCTFGDCFYVRHEYLFAGSKALMNTLKRRIHMQCSRSCSMHAVLFHFQPMHVGRAYWLDARRAVHWPPATDKLRTVQRTEQRKSRASAHTPYQRASSPHIIPRHLLPTALRTNSNGCSC